MAGQHRASGATAGTSMAVASSGQSGRGARSARGELHLPPRAAVGVPLALAIVGLGVLIVIAPSSVPGLTPPT